MPGIFGALSVDRGDVDLGGDLASLRILPEQRVDLLDLGALRIASVERPGEPARQASCPRTGATLLLKGVVSVASAEALLSRILAEGREAAVALPGHYVAIFWEPGLGRLSIMNDGLGLYPLYTWSQGGTFLFGTQPWAFERARTFRREVDPEAVLELLRIEYLLGGRAMSKGVRLVEPGSIVEVSRGGKPTTRVVRDLFRERDLPPASLDEAAERLGAAYDTAFGRMVPATGALLVPLSGGKDSRTVLCETLRREAGARGRLETLSLGSLEQWDARCARRLARVMGVPWRSVPFDETLHGRWLERFVRLMDGSSSVYATWWAAVMEATGDERPAILSGYLGDALSGGHLRFFHPDADREGAKIGFDPGVEAYLVKLGRRSFSREQLAKTLRPEVAEAYLDGPAWTLRREYFGLMDAPRHVRMLRTDVLHRQRRFIASQLHLYRQRHAIVAPFTDPAIVRAFLSMTEDQVRRQRAYTHALARRHPEAARVMEARSRRPFQGGLADRLRCAAEEKLLDLRARVNAKLFGIAPPEREFLNFRHKYEEDLVNDLEPLDRFFDPDALRALLSRERTESNRIRILFTLREWLRREGKPALEAAA